jgi:dihydroflavonol-4-reductase
VKAILVTGATGFLGYHVAKRLNDIGFRPRVLEAPDSRLEVLDGLDVDRCSGHLDDLTAVSAACGGVDTLLHLAFKVSVGSGARLLEEMRRVNIEGTRRLLLAAAASGVQRVVITGSALAVGVNRKAVPLDESADWSQHAFDIPYANIRREAELEALAQSSATLGVVSVCPSFTFGPDDPVGAPANGLVRGLISRKLRFTLPVGFGCLDVRDFADAMVLAAKRGRSGHRYLVSGENVTANQLVKEVAGIAGVRAPWFTPPTPLLHVAVAGLEAFSALRKKPAPITRGVLQIINRYAWYDTSKARTELGWTPRPLRETLVDTVAWLKSPAGNAASKPAGQRKEAV